MALMAKFPTVQQEHNTVTVFLGVGSKRMGQNFDHLFPSVPEAKAKCSVGISCSNKERLEKNVLYKLNT